MRLSGLLADLRLMCPGMPEPWQYRFLTRSLQTFLSSTQVWQEWTEHAYDFTYASAGKFVVPNSKYNPVGPSDPVPVVRTDRVLRVKWLPSGENVPKTTQLELDEQEPDWMTQRNKEPKVWFPVTSGYHSVTGYTVQLYPYPASADDNTTGALKFFVSHTITETETPDQVYQLESALGDGPVADWVFRRYREVILAGALARALLVPNVAWSNPDLAALYAGQFVLGMDTARSEAQAGQTTSHVLVDYGGY